MAAMRVRLRFVLAAIAAFGCAGGGGCTHYRELRPGEPAAETASLRAELQGRNAELTLRDGSILSARRIELGADSVRFEGAGDGARRAVALVDLRRIAVRHPGRGARDGGKAGFVAGGVAGFVLGGLLSTVDICFENCDREPVTIGRVLRGGIVGACALGALGYPVGLLAGAAAGSTIQVEVRPGAGAGRDSSEALPPKPR